MRKEEIEVFREKEQALQNEVDRLDADNEELLIQLGLLRQLQEQERDVYETNISELVSSMEDIFGEALRAKQDQVAAMEIALLDSELSLDAQRQESDKIQKLSRHVNDIEQRLSRKDQMLTDLKLQREFFKAKLMSVTVEFEVEKKMDIDAKMKELIQELQISPRNHQHRTTEFLS